MSLEATLKVKKDKFYLNVKISFGNGITGIFGLSGAGKTTLLRTLAGLEKNTGNIFVDGEVWQNESKLLDTSQRKVGFVFQNPSLFPHLSVRKNLEFGLNRTPAEGRKFLLEETSHELNLVSLLDRSVTNLSGGETQRVAIAQSLLSSPKILLLDEPLSSIDVQSSTQILNYLKSLNKTFKLPIFFVSHNTQDILALADEILVLKTGEVSFQGKPGDYFKTLECSGVVVSHSLLFTEVDTKNGRLKLPLLPVERGETIEIKISKSNPSS